jgi:TetR/AcrR family fatty acid metabolism transcriptional regulator
MNEQKGLARVQTQSDNKGLPPGYIKITQALRTLLKEKEFEAITWAEIAEVGGVNQGLISKYFKTKRNLLHQLLKQYYEQNLRDAERAVKGVEGAFNKLRSLIRFNLESFSKERVFARIVLLEVRNSPGYFQCDTYKLVKRSGDMISEILEEGIRNGEIRDDISSRHMRRVILGATEHLFLPGLLFDREIDPDELTEIICKLVFPGLKKR